MSFVSIIARQSWISIVSDGRVMSDSEIVAEDFQKFLLPRQNRFIAFAGNKQPCEVVVKGMEELGHNELGLEEAAKHMSGMVRMLGDRDYHLFMATGGFGSSGAEIYVVSTQSQYPVIHKPGANDVCFTFLSNTCISDQDLSSEFERLIRAYGTASAQQSKQAQIALNSWVSAQDNTVNEKTFECQLYRGA